MISEVTISIGKYELTQRQDGTYWLRHESGEGMETSLEKLESAINEFYEREF